MPRRPAGITQAEIARALRAFREAKLPNMRVRITSSSVIVEQAEPPAESRERADEIADDDEVVIL
jgi:hypothetical protein